MIKISNTTQDISFYSCKPQCKEELRLIICNRIKSDGPNCDLNDIDTSEITDMSELFYFSEFNGDISKWNVSNAKDMACMFDQSKFNQPIGDWNVSNVEDMSYMFYKSSFNQDISKWNMSNVKNMSFIFYEDKAFDQDISSWDIDVNICNTHMMFKPCSIKEEYKPKRMQRFHKKTKSALCMAKYISL